MKGGYAVHLTHKFSSDYAALPVDIRRAVDRCIADLARDPLPGSRRAHAVTAKGHKPTVFSLDVTPNKSHKLSFHLEGNVAVLRRVATHRQIDRGP